MTHAVIDVFDSIQVEVGVPLGLLKVFMADVDNSSVEIFDGILLPS